MAAAENTKQVDKVKTPAGCSSWWDCTNQVVETALDVGDSGSSFLSIVGGPIAAIGIMDAYGQNYDKARRGLSEEAAAEYATANAAQELISLIPAARFGGETAGLQAQALLPRARSLPPSSARWLRLALQRLVRDLERLPLRRYGYAKQLPV